MIVSIIGTAGRGDDLKKLNLHVYGLMFRAFVVHLNPEDDLQSGGAAWGDHLGVLAYAGGWCRSLTLFLPAELDRERNQFYGSDDARVTNHYHLLFANALGIPNTIQHIVEVERMGARLIVEPGFKNRNGNVAKCQKLVAETFGRGSVPKDGGTKDTWDRSDAPEKIHIPIGSLR